MRPIMIGAGFALVGVGLLAGLVWWLGPLLPWLEPAWVRASVIGVLTTAWLGTSLFLLWRERRRAAALATGLIGAEEEQALRDRFTEALALLKQQGGASALYKQPWYVIIGPPGAGKTTALLNAGLTFPLAATMGEAPLQGVGGTRRCDWWFTDQAVLIDTAGRYTTQDSDAQADRAGWLAFLDLLARTRPRQPLNGVIIAISATEIAGAPMPLRRAHASAIRERITELEKRLGVRLPVYVLFTKADLIVGFTEYFDDLDAERRGQVWGSTFPWPVRGEPDTALAWAGLVARLDAGVATRLQAERSPERRTVIAGFPAQVASLVEPLSAFLGEAFGGARLRAAPLLRGFYLTSGTQEGTPVDRLTGLLSRAFGVDQRRATSLRPVRGRSLFLHRLLAGVMPGEAMLVSAGAAALKRVRLIRMGAFGAVALATLAGVLFVWRQHAAVAADQAAMGIGLDRYGAEAARHKLDPVAEADLPAIVTLLDTARALPASASAGDELGAVASSSYRHALEWTLLPRLVRRLEQQIAAAAARPDYAYEATRVYLMLGGAGPLDPSLVREWMRLDWELAWPGPGQAPARAKLAQHLDALLAQPLPPITLDGALVERARATFSQVTPGARVYARIRQSAVPVAPWRPRDALGPLGAPLFTRTSGKKLDDGVPGLLTAAGYRTALLPALNPAIRAVAAESWVWGARTGLADDPAALAAVETEVVRRYTADYIRTWDAMLADLQFVKLASAGQASQDLFALQSPISPLRNLLSAVAQQVGGAGAGVAQHYRPLLDLVGDGPGAPVEQALRSLTDVQQMLAKINIAPIGVAPLMPPGDPPSTLRADAQRWPAPLNRWMRGMADDAAALRTAATPRAPAGSP